MSKPWSPQLLARWIAILLLISLVLGGFGESYVPGTLVAAGNASATAGNIIVHQTLFRLSLGAYLIEGLCDVALTALLYLLLKPAGRELVLIALLLRIVATAAFAAAEFFYFAALPILHDVTDLKAFPTEQLDALALLVIRLYGTSGSIPTFFYAIAWIVMGRLVFLSGYLPRWLGVVLAIGGLAATAGMFANVVVPLLASGYLLLPMLVSMLILALTLLIRGVNAPRWNGLAAGIALAEDTGLRPS